MDLSVLTSAEVLVPAVTIGAVIVTKLLPPTFAYPVKLLAKGLIALADSKSFSMEKGQKAKEELMSDAIAKVAETASKNSLGVTVKPEQIADIVKWAQRSKGFDSADIQDAATRFTDFLKAKI